MTENQQKELFTTLASLVTGVNGVQSDVREIKSDVVSIKATLSEHSRILGEHSRILDEHSQMLGVLVSKVDSIAETVMTNDKRLGVVEKHVDDLRGEVH